MVKYNNVSTIITKIFAEWILYEVTMHRIQIIIEKVFSIREYFFININCLKYKKTIEKLTNCRIWFSAIESVAIMKRGNNQQANLLYR